MSVCIVLLYLLFVWNWCMVFFMVDIFYDEFWQGYQSVFVCEHCMVTYRSDDLFGSEVEAFINGEVEEALHRSLPHVILEGV